MMGWRIKKRHVPLNRQLTGRLFPPTRNVFSGVRRCAEPVLRGPRMTYGEALTQIPEGAEWSSSFR